MIDGPSGTDNYVSRPEEERVSIFINGGESLVHISGEPGVGKTWILSRTKQEYRGRYDIAVETIGEHYQIDDFYRVIYHAILQNLPEELKKEDTKLRGLSVGPVGGASWDKDSPDAPVLRQNYRDVLKEIADFYPDKNNLLICIDDIHKLSTTHQEVKDAVKEAARLLEGNITLVTAGQLKFDSLSSTVDISTFTAEQSILHLKEAFPEIPDQDAKKIHDELGGHPLYLDLLIESNDGDGPPTVPKGDIYNEIEKRYLKSLSDDEERFLLATSPLQILNEKVCAYVTPETHEVDQVTASRLLRSLSDRVIVQELGRDQNHLSQFKIHDTFREFLLGRLDDDEEIATHSRAFEYYAGQTRDLIASDDVSLETEVRSIRASLQHLSEETAGSSSDALIELINSCFTEDGLSIYPSILLIDKLKQWNAENLLDELKDAIIIRLDNEEKIAHQFYDDDAHISWAEELYSRGRFKDPDNVSLSFLSRIAGSHPEFTLRVIKQSDSDNPYVQRFFISICQDLPVPKAAEVSEYIAEWVRTTSKYHELVFHGLRLVKPFCENGEFDAAISIIGASLHSRPVNTGSQFDEDQGMTRYTITNTLDDVIDDLLTERSDNLVDLFRSKLEHSLRTDNGDSEYDTIAERRAIGQLDYIESNISELKHLLLDYFTETAEYWVNENPDSNERRYFILDLLDAPTTIRRVGLFLLGNHPKTFTDQVQTELLIVDNYYGKTTDFEFYRMLKTGFKHLELEQQHEICKIIREGPYTEDVHQRAEWLAEEEDKPESYFENRIKEKWRRDRLFLIRNSLPEGHAEYLEELLNKYGDPERSPDQPHYSTVVGGRVHERGPSRTEEYRKQSPKDVLTEAVEWEPPESSEWDIWERDEDGTIEEFNHVGFSRQLKELIQEQPEKYAREISILEDAEPQYATAAFRAFIEILDEGQTFPWDSIIYLCEAIAANPKNWSNGCRTNIAKLLHAGILNDGIEFPLGYETETKELLITLSNDSDPDDEVNQTSEEEAGNGNPAFVAVNSVRPMACDALVSYSIWLHDEKGQERTDDDLSKTIRSLIVDDSSLAVLSTIGRRLYSLWHLYEDLIEEYIERIFPRDLDGPSRTRFVTAWNSFTSHHGYWENNLIRPYYVHAICLLDAEEEDNGIQSKSIAAHIASAYITGNETLENEDSLVFKFYQNASSENAADVAASIATTATKDDGIDNHWDAVKKLWNWRLDIIESADLAQSEQDNQRLELMKFLNAARDTSTATLASEDDLIVRSFPFVSDYSFSFRTLEERFAESSDAYPAVAIDLYQELVDSVPSESWSTITRISQDDLRKTLYQNAVAKGGNPRRTALEVANRFVAEGLQMDRDFMDEHLGGS